MVKRDDRKRPRDPLHEGLPPLSPLLGVGVVHASEQFACRDRRKRDGFVGKDACQDVEVEALPLPCDEDARVDQLGHMSVGTPG